MDDAILDQDGEQPTAALEPPTVVPVLDLEPVAEIDAVDVDDAETGRDGGVDADLFAWPEEDDGNNLHLEEKQSETTRREEDAPPPVENNNNPASHEDTSRVIFVDGNKEMFVEAEEEDSVYPVWMRSCFGVEALAEVDALRCHQTIEGTLVDVDDGQLREDDVATINKPISTCEECNKRVVAFHCHECALSLCFTCTDAIHILPVFATHTISLVATSCGGDENHHSTIPPPPLTGVYSAGNPLPELTTALSSPPKTRAVKINTNVPLQFTPSTHIEDRLHLPIGTKLFFRVDDCGRWPRELLHGTVVGLDHGVRGAAAIAPVAPPFNPPPAMNFYYRVLWLRGVEALANGFFRANLLLPAPSWPIEIGLFPSQLGAFRAVVTAERLARAKFRRERVSGRWHERHHNNGHDQLKRTTTDDALAFPCDSVLDEIRLETDAILGQEFRTRLTQQDDASFLQDVSSGKWTYTQWMASIGRAGDLNEEAVAIQELEDELRTMETTQESPLSSAAELLLLWSPRGRIRFFLMEQQELLLPETIQRAHVASIIHQMLFVYVGFAWHRWRKFIQRHRRYEEKQRREVAAVILQHWWRRCVDNEKTKQQRLAMASSLNALDLYRRRQVEAAKLYRWMEKQYTDKQRHALHRWADHTVDPEARRRRQRMLDAKAVAAHDTWHPSHGIASLPRLPRMYAHKKIDGSVAIEDLKLYKQFRANHAGPTESSYWIIHHRVMAGVYPAGVAAFRDARRIVSRADYITSLLLEEIGTFICLAEPSELQDHEPNVDASCLLQQQQLKQQRERKSVAIAGSSSPRATTYQTPWLFERIIRAKHDSLRVELAAAVKMSERLQQLAHSELEAFEAPLPVALDVASLSNETLAHRETLLNKLALAQQNARTARASLTQIKPLDFVGFPIPKDGVPHDGAALELFLQSVEAKLRRHERVYLFSMHGHGRTGLVAALLLGRLYGITSTEALERAQRLHDCQYAMHGVAAAKFVSSPHTAAQRAMVTQLVARYNDAIYAPVVTENRAESYFLWRAQQRGVPIEKFAGKDGFMVSDRVDEQAQNQQNHEFELLQRIAKRESAATKLTFARRRQERERKAMAEDDHAATTMG